MGDGNDEGKNVRTTEVRTRNDRGNAGMTK